MCEITEIKLHLCSRGKWPERPRLAGNNRNSTHWLLGEVPFTKEHTGEVAPKLLHISRESFN